MTGRNSPPTARAILGLGLLIGWSECEPTASAQTARPVQATEVGLEQAYDRTLRSGMPTLIVVTSRSVPDSDRLWSSLSGLGRSPQGPRCQVVRLLAEDHPRELEGFGVTRAPAVVLVRREGAELKVAGQHAGFFDAKFVNGWLALLATEPQAPGPADRKLVRAQYDDGPSPQGSPQSYPAPRRAPMPIPQYQPPPQPQPQPYYPPPMAPYYPPPSVVSPPQQPIFVQPSSPTVVVGPAQPPSIIYAGNAPPSAYAPPPAPTASAPPNLLGPPNNTGNAPPANPTGFAPPQPPYTPPQPAYAPPSAYAPPAYSPPQAYAPPPIAYAPPPAQSLGSAPAPILTNPSLLNRLLGTVGEAMAERKNPRIRMSTAPAYAPAAFAAPAQYAAAPPQAPPGYYITQMPPPYPYVEYEPEEQGGGQVARPSPQGRGHAVFHKQAPPAPRKSIFSRGQD